MRSRVVCRSARSGFTLIELLVVISIIALLISLLLPSLGKARETARNSQCLANMHGIAVAMAGYAGDYKGWWPTVSAVDGPDNPSSLAVAGRNIYGIAAPWDTNFGPSGVHKAGPLGLGQLARPVVDQGDPGVIYGSYMELRGLFCPNQGAVPDEVFYFQKYASQYFGAPWKIYSASEVDPAQNVWWTSGYGAFYFPGSYAYRAAHRGVWDGTNAAGMASWTNITSYNNLRNLHSDTAGNNQKSIVAETGGGTWWLNQAGMPRQSAHKALGGANALFGDGSAFFWKNADVANNEFSNAGGWGLPGFKYSNTYAGLFPETHHWIYPNLVFAAIDRDFQRDGILMP